ncbi:MAG: PfkB family carbohydrate kinase [Solirubrobacteraceae bacterium]
MNPETTIQGLDHKIYRLEDFGEVRERVREAGETLVQCHGVFDLLHPGHVSHLQEARALGDRVVVSVTADCHVNKGPGRPVFPHGLRMSTLAALEVVDFVVLSEHETAIPSIETIQPDVYAKGREYEDLAADVTGSMAREKEAVERHGGEVRYLGGIVFSSTKLLNRHFDAIPAQALEWAQDFATRHSKEDIREVVDSMRSLKVLVVGEVIVDEYIRCEPQGVTVKDHIPSVRAFEEERQWGGAYAVARHLAGFCGGVTLTGIAGEGEEVAGGPTPHGAAESIAREFVTDPGARTVVKQRFVIENPKRDELDKVFSVKEMADPWAVSAASRERFRSRLAELISEHDTVVITDYGHGLLDEETMELLQDRSPYLALNCQTNSSNFGFNPITRYRRADTFSVDQVELHIAYRERGGDEAAMLARLREQLAARVAWLTLGSSGSLASTVDGKFGTTPALTLRVRDTIGAGDAFFALASLCARTSQPAEVGSFLGNIAGALAANVTGNREAVSSVDLLKFSSTILNV